MAAIILTSTKKTNGITLDDGSTMHGFTGGVAQAGIKPTQLSAAYFDALSGELGNVIRGIHSADSIPTLDANSKKQVMDAINGRFLKNYPKSAPPSPWVFEWRSEYLVGSQINWKVRQRTDSELNVSANNIYYLCNFAPPDDSQFFVEYSVLIVDTNSLTSRFITKLLASGRRASGTITIQAGEQPFLDNALVGGPIDSSTGVTVTGQSGQVCIKVEIGPDANNFNIMVDGKITIVTLGT
ncbi:MAG: hypothetical protein JNL82_14525 [Myxococcales bacterium]|nr:hypothetical protein [Myxococcales bacterium]